jgi:hypothetical protein
LGRAGKERVWGELSWEHSIPSLIRAYEFALK